MKPNLEPLISLYITNFNYADYIDQAIESALAQTFDNYEIIIIDDGSTDNSREIIKKYEEHPKVRVIYQQNKGLNRTNNVAIKAARGEFIMRLDADDYLDDNALLVFCNAIKSDEKVALVFSNYYYVDKYGNITAQERRHDFKNSVSLLDQPAHGACSLIRKEALVEVGMYCEGFSCQDGYDLWIKLIEKYKVKNIDLPLFYYRRHGKNQTENKEKLQETRAKIYATYIGRRNHNPLKTIAVVPVRGKTMEPSCMALRTLSNKPLIDWTIEAALEAENISEVIVSTPDTEILGHTKKVFGDRIITHVREKDLSHENTSYDQAIKNALSCRKLNMIPDAIMCLTVESPFRSALYIDKAVNSMRIFDTEVLIAVIPENDLFYQHHGDGIRSIGVNETINNLCFERDYLYRQAGGLFLVKYNTYIKNDFKYPSKGIGHIVLSKQAGCKVTTEEELYLAEALISYGKDIK